MSDPVSFLSASLVVGAASLPLALKLIPPNRFYGFRTSRTLSDRALWFRVNRFAGCVLLAASLVSSAVFVFRPELASGRSFQGLLAFAVPLFIALAATIAYGRNAAEGHEG